MSITLDTLTLALAVFNCAIAGYLFRQMLEWRTGPRITEEIKHLLATFHALELAHSEAVEMLAEKDRLDELGERTADALRDHNETINDVNELIDVDSTGASVLGEGHPPVTYNLDVLNDPNGQNDQDSDV